MCEQSEGAKLKAWRERLGLSEAWAEQVLGDYALTRFGTAPLPDTVSRQQRRQTAEGLRIYYPTDCAEELRAAYAAALKAEEGRQAAERTQAEPVCPEGVEVATSADGTYTNIRHAGRLYADGSFETLATCDDHRVALRYLLDLADYRARKHAEGDRQRKLDAVKAAEEALDNAERARSVVWTSTEEARRKARDAASAAADALAAARREAGL